ncbi:DUF1028 domain-containing protein [Xanthomonas theicola]|nr:DUF1028 domain-containing protein [Xanthomonas theicola]
MACTQSGTCRAAVATNNLAVGATVIYAKAQVGAVASQYETNPSCGPKGIALLQRHASAERWSTHWSEPTMGSRDRVPRSCKWGWSGCAARALPSPARRPWPRPGLGRSPGTATRFRATA